MGVLMKNKVCYTGNNGKNVAVGHYDNIGVPQVFFSEKSGNKINCGLDARYITTITSDPIAFFKWKRYADGSYWVVYAAVSLRPLNYGSDYSHNNEHADLVEPVITTVDGTVVYVYRESGGWAYSNNPDVVINDTYHISNLFATDDDIVYNSKFLKDIVTTLKNKSEDSYDTLIQPVIYSTDEREIGVWTDGKPLYEKVIFPTFTQDLEDETFNIENIDKVISLSGMSSTYTAQIPFIVNLSYRISVGIVQITSAAITLRLFQAGGYVPNYIVIRYTKTTDTPGSGIWATNGAPAKHYSTTEQVIGTWIDGSTIYEKTVTINTLSSGSDQKYNHGISNIDKIVGWDSIFVRSDGATIQHFATAGSGYKVEVVSIDRTQIGITTEREIYDTFTNAYITIRYTKSAS